MGANEVMGGKDKAQLQMGVAFVKSSKAKPDKDQVQEKKTFKTKMPTKKTVRFADDNRSADDAEELTNSQIPSKRTFT